ncbi:substrate-binding periplasmic protein [Bdellovibrio sp. HCB290]|uniref:substrate-binding periplasmic protein n=1 Tax=Bdellovibrio sp. HCB290 TaxID=3394356 RepID=UPI0039B644E6
MKSLLLYSLITLLLTTASAKEVRLVTFPIPLMVEGRSDGLFLNLTHEIANRVSVKFKVDVVKSNQAKLEFFNGLASGYFPGMDNSTPKDALRSIPFYVRTNYIFYRSGSAFKTLKDLRGKKVGLTFRYHYPPEIQGDTKIKFSYADDDITNMRRLSEGIIDAFIVEERSGLRALELSRSKDISYNKDSPVSSQNCYYAFRNDEEGRVLLKEFNSALTKMQEDGSLQKVLKFGEPSAIKKTN